MKPETKAHERALVAGSINHKVTTSVNKFLCAGGTLNLTESSIRIEILRDNIEFNKTCGTFGERTMRVYDYSKDCASGPISLSNCNKGELAICGQNHKKRKTP